MSESSASPMPLASPITPSAAMIQEVQHERKSFFAVYVVLMVGTVLTVAMHYVHFEAMWMTVTVAMLIAAIKAAFVASVFMHLWHGQRNIYQILFFTGVFVITMLGFLTYSFFSLPGSGHHLR